MIRFFLPFRRLLVVFRRYHFFIERSNPTRFTIFFSQSLNFARNQGRPFWEVCGGRGGLSSHPLIFYFFLYKSVHLVFDDVLFFSLHVDFFSFVKFEIMGFCVGNTAVTFDLAKILPFPQIIVGTALLATFFYLIFIIFNMDVNIKYNILVPKVST